MKCSLVLTVYNGEKYILEQLESIYNQSRKIDEIIIYDDSSTDKSCELINKFIRDFDWQECKIIYNDTNVGWRENFYKGMNQASNDIVFLCDQDDIWHLDKIEKLMSCFEIEPDVKLLVSNYHSFNQDGIETVKAKKLKKKNNSIFSQVVIDNKTIHTILRPGCCMAYKKEIQPIFNELWTKDCPHDALLWQIAALMNSIYIYDEPLIEFRRHDNNATGTFIGKKKTHIDYLNRSARVLKYFSNNNNLTLNINKMIKFFNYRINFIENHKFFNVFLLLFYVNYYLDIKKYINEIIIFFKKN